MGSKNSGAGPKWVVKQERLTDALTHEIQMRDALIKLLPEDGLQNNPQVQKVSEAIKTWFRMYHAVVQLVAAKNPPGVHRVNTREAGVIDCPPPIAGQFCHEDSYLLPAFGLEEEDSNSLSGLMFEQMINRFKQLYQSGALGSRFIQENNSAQSIVARLLSKYQPLPPGNFVQTKQDIINRCQDSVATLTTGHDQTDTLVRLALELIEVLWGEEIEKHLAEVDLWLNHSSVGSEQWWNETIGVDDSLRNKLSNLFPNGDRDIQKQVGQVTAASHLIGDFLIFIENRLVYADDNDISHGFEGVITKYSQLDQQAWSQLLSITWGALAWQAVNQARAAIVQVNAMV